MHVSVQYTACVSVQVHNIHTYTYSIHVCMYMYAYIGVDSTESTQTMYKFRLLEKLVMLLDISYYFPKLM